jgi:hypothetical protein
MPDDRRDGRVKQFRHGRAHNVERELGLSPAHRVGGLRHARQRATKPAHLDGSKRHLDTRTRPVT